MSRSQKRSRSSSEPSSRKKRHTEKETTTEPAPTPTFDADFAAFEEMLRGIGGNPNVTTETGDPGATTITLPVATAPVPRARPENPWARRVKKISNTWGSGVHEQMHFAPTATEKDYHGVWGTRKLSEVREWVSLARTSIYDNDDFVVASKPGENGGRNFLVDMDGQTVGYISGSKVPTGTKPEAKHLAVYVNKKGYISTAFPCTPEIFQR